MVGKTIRNKPIARAKKTEKGLTITIDIPNDLLFMNEGMLKMINK